MHTRSRLALPVLLAAGALALSACSGGGVGGIDQRSELSVADGYLRAVAAGDYEKACSVVMSRSDGEWTPIAGNAERLENCVKYAEWDRERFESKGVLALAENPKGTFTTDDPYWTDTSEAVPSVVYPGLGVDKMTDKAAHLTVEKIDGKFYVDPNF